MVSLAAWGAALLRLARAARADGLDGPRCHMTFQLFSYVRKNDMFVGVLEGTVRILVEAQAR